MLPKNIIKIIGEPGKNAVLILDTLFKGKKKQSLNVVYDDDIRKYCVKNPKKAVLSPAAAVSEAQVLKWYGVVKLTKRENKLVIEKDKMFDNVAKLAKKMPKSKPKPKPRKPRKKKSFESIFDSFLIKPVKKKGDKNGKPRLHLLQNSKRRNPKQKSSRGRKVSRVPGHKPKSKRPRARHTKKPLRNISRHAKRGSKRNVRSGSKTRKKAKRKTKR